jgi:uncharacterized cupin superfamily protein
MNRLQWVSWVLVGVGFGGCAIAADALPPSLRACMSESDTARRLACFDRESARLANDSVARASAPAPAPRRPDPPAAAPPPAATAPAAALPAATTAQSAAAPAAAAAQSAEEKFGFRGSIARAEHDKQEAEERQFEQLTAKVAELSTLPHGEMQLTLDNGQVWQQKPGDRAMRVKVGDEVTIRRGSLGSFLLTTTAKGSMRVTRVK